MHNDSFLTWVNGEPFSTLFEDIYFSQAHGLQETDHVFLQQNHLQQRWHNLTHSHFTIIETGFGTGLNFLCSCRLWLDSAKPEQRLHFISCERHPLSLKQLHQAHALWPELAEFSHALLEQYALLGLGFHRFHLFDQRISLTLFIGDVMDMMKQLHGVADAWFLDGFAPAKNPAMWQAALFQSMAKHSKAGTSFATFTAAGEVRRGLLEAGFVVNKIPGYGKKREMLSGHFGTDNKPEQAFHPTGKSKTAIILGAGVAGLTSAHALAKRGWHCSVIDKHSDVAQEASGNPVAVLYPRPNLADNPLNQLALACYQYTINWLKQLQLCEQDYDLCGVLQLAKDHHEAKRLAEIAQHAPAWASFLPAHQVNQISGIDLNQPGLYFPDAGWIKPHALCRRLSNSAGVLLQLHRQALRLEQTCDGWRLWDGSEVMAEADVLILANAYHIADFSQSQHCELTPVAGQISLLPPYPELQKLSCVICSDAYLTPNIDGLHSLGATFEPYQTNLSVTAEAHQKNLESLQVFLPDFDGATCDLNQWQGRSAIRSCSFDYLPMLGAVIDQANMPSPVMFQRNKQLLPPLHRGLYIHAGHGAKGLLQAPLCAEILACQINSEPMPVGVELLAALNPNRQLLKRLGLKSLKQQYHDPLQSQVQTG